MRTSGDRSVLDVLTESGQRVGHHCPDPVSHPRNPDRLPREGVGGRSDVPTGCPTERKDLTFDPVDPVLN